MEPYAVEPGPRPCLVLGSPGGSTIITSVLQVLTNVIDHGMTVQEAVDQIKDVKALYKSDDRFSQLFDYSITLEGLSRHASVHAAGVVIAPGPLDEYVPICTQNKGSKNGSNGDDGSLHNSTSPRLS